MKRIIVLLAVIILSSCSKDDNSIDIEGTWLRTESYANGYQANFNNGIVKFYRNSDFFYDATYKIKGDKITIRPDVKKEDYVYTIKFSSDTLKLSAYSQNFLADGMIEPNMSFVKK